MKKLMNFITESIATIRHIAKMVAFAKANPTDLQNDKWN